MRVQLGRTFEGDIDEAAVPTPCWVFDILLSAGFDDAVDAAAPAFKDGLAVESLRHIAVIGV